MPKPVTEYPVIFDSGWDTRGAEVGQPVTVKDMWNAWLSRWENGAVESMPGEAALITWSGADGPILNIAMGTSQEGLSKADGDEEDVESGTISILGAAQYGEIFYKHYPRSTTSTQGMLTNTFGTATYKWCFSAMPRLNDKFHIYQAVPSYDSVDYPLGRKPQVTEIGSTSIDDIGVLRPVIESDDLYITPSTTTTTNVKGIVKYWVSAVEEGGESALSDQVPRYEKINYGLQFNGVEWQEVSMADGSALEVDPQTSDWSIEFFMKINPDDKPPAQRRFFEKYSLGSDEGWYFHVGGQGKMNLTIVDNNISSYEYTVTSKDDICDGFWHRFSVTWENTGATTGTLKLYRDGELQDTESCTIDSDDWCSNSYTMHFGSNFEDDGKQFRYQISDIRIYAGSDISSQVVDGGTLYKHMHSRIPDVTVAPWTTTGTILTGYWPFSEGSGTTAEDMVDLSGVGTNDADFLLQDENYPKWIKVSGYGLDSIDMGEYNSGEGGGVDIVFAGTQYHGKKWRIYRSVADGSQPFYLSTFKPKSGAYTYTDVILDENLGDLPFLHGDQPPSTTTTDLRPAVAHLNRIFTAVVNRVYWTDISNDESYFTQDNGNWVSVFSEDGDKITALVSDFDSLVIFKANHLYRLHGRRPEEFTLRPVVPGTDINISVGTPNLNSVCSTPEGIFFYWNRKVFQLQGDSLRIISDPIAEKLEALTLVASSASTEYTTVAMGYWAQRNQVWLSIGDGSQTPNKSFIYSLSTGRWVGMRNRGYYNAQSARGVGSWSKDLYEEKFIGAIPSGLDGTVVEIVDSTATTYQTSTTYSSYMEVSPFYGRNLNNQKRYLWVDVIFKPTSTTDDKLDVIWWVDGDSANATTVSLPMDSTVLGINSTQTRYRSRVNINEVGQSLSIKVSNVPNTDGKWKLYGLVYGYQDLPSVSR